MEQKNIDKNKISKIDTNNYKIFSLNEIDLDVLIKKIKNEKISNIS